MEAGQPKEAKVLLRIVAGDQCGAAIELEPRATYAIGTSEECRIALIGDGIEPVHIEAVFLDGELTILRCAAGVKVNGKPLQALPAIVGQRQLIAFADVAFAYGAADTDWRQLEEVAARQGAVEEGAAAVKRERGLVSRVVAAGGAAGLLVAVFASLGVVFWRYLDQADPNKGRITPNLERRFMKEEVLAVIESEDKYVGKVMIKDEGSVMMVKGLVDNAEDILSLRQEIGSFNLMWNVASRFQVESELELALRKYDRGLLYDIDVDEGVVSLVVKGVLSSEVSSGRLRAIISQNLPLIEDITVVTSGSDEVMEAVYALLDGKKQYRDLKAEFTGRTLRLFGPILANYANVEIDVAEVLAKFQPHGIRYEPDLKVGPLFEGELSSVLISETSYAVFRFGDREIRAVEGSKLPGEIWLVSIAPDLLVVKYDGQEYYLSKS